VWSRQEVPWLTVLWQSVQEVLALRQAQEVQEVRRPAPQPEAQEVQEVQEAQEVQEVRRPAPQPEAQEVQQLERAVRQSPRQPPQVFRWG
jgi:hypothetical protein